MFVTVITKTAIEHSQRAVRFCLNKAILHPTITFQNRKFMIVDQYYSKTLDLFMSVKICCSAFIVLQSMTLCFHQENVMMQYIWRREH